MVASRWCWVADGGGVLLGNAHTGLGLRRCARGKCMHRVASRIVMVVWVVGLRRGARGKCMQRVGGGLAALC